MSLSIVERWILMRLRHHRFATVDDVNEAIEPLLDRLNSKAFQKLPGSRTSTFADLDAPALQALPLQPWEWAAFKNVRVHIDHHVEVEGHRYSVPQNLVGLLLEARITTRAVELLHRGQRVAAHQRSAHKGASQPSSRTCRRRTARTSSGRPNAWCTGARASAWPPAVWSCA